MLKRRKIRFKRRLIIYSFLVLILISAGLDYYCEVYGLPAAADNFIRNKLNQNGFDIVFSDFKFGILNGAVVTDLQLYDKELCGEALFTADKVSLSFDLSVSESFFLKVTAFEISQGQIRIPLFPESGHEGINDVIEISNVDAIVSWSGKDIDIEYLSGKLSPFKFSCAGKLKNIFGSALAGSGSALLNSKASDRFRLMPVIKHLDFETRAEIYRRLWKVKTQHIFKKPPELNLVFNIDVLQPEKSGLKGDFLFPEFHYKSLGISNIHSVISLHENQLKLEKFKILLDDNRSRLNISGIYNISDELLTGSLSGKISTGTLVKLIKTTETELPAGVSLDSNEMIDFSLGLVDFSLNTLTFRGKSHIQIPQLKLKGEIFRDITADLLLSDKHIVVPQFSCITGDNQITGSCRYNPESKNAGARVKILGFPRFIPGLLEKTYKEDTADFLSRFTPSSVPENTILEFDINLAANDHVFYYASGNIMLEEFSYNGTFFNKGTACLICDSNNLFIIPFLEVENTLGKADIKLAYDASEPFTYSCIAADFSPSDCSSDRIVCEISSTLGGNDLIKGIAGKWEADAISLPFPIDMKGQGSVDFADTGKTNFMVKVQNSEFLWKKIPVKAADCGIAFIGNCMKLERGQGEVYSGALSFSYNIDFETDKGDLKLALDKAELLPLTKILGWEFDQQEKSGRISVNIDSDLAYADSGALQMNGKGNLAVIDANLWEVPIINEFGEITRKWLGNNLGVISALNADVVFKDESLYSENIQTDGDIVSLKGKGWYRWSDENFEFTIRAQLLKRILPYRIISRIFDPLSLLLETRVYRQNGETQWDKIAIVRKIMKNIDNNSDE